MAKGRPDDLHGVRLFGQAGERCDAALAGRKVGEPHEELLELRGCRREAAKNRARVSPVFCHVCGVPRGMKTNVPTGASKT